MCKMKVRGEEGVFFKSFLLLFVFNVYRQPYGYDRPGKRVV